MGLKVGYHYIYLLVSYMLQSHHSGIESSGDKVIFERIVGCNRTIVGLKACAFSIVVSASLGCNRTIVGLKAASPTLLNLTR